MSDGIRPLVAVAAHLDAAARSLIGQELAGERLHWIDKHVSTTADRSAVASAEVVFGNVPAAWLAESHGLRWLQLESVGCEYYANATLPAGLVITNLAGQFAAPAVETALAGLLGLLRGLPELVAAQGERRWIELELRPRTGMVHGRRCLVLGTGSIGGHLATVLRALGAQVTTFARTDPQADLHGTDELDAALPTTDVLCCTLPCTAATRGLIDRRRLALLPAGAILVNIGRGPVIDEAGLVEALQGGRLGGAVLDVFDHEPLPADHPLWACPRTVLTQHTGGGYRDELLDKARRFVANWRRFRAGEPLLHRIDPQRGY